MSGGGFRASAFHLGTLSYLNEINIIEEIDTLSSVSGGAFTCMIYTLYIKQNKQFKDIYTDLYKFFKEHNLLKESTSIIGKDAPHTMTKDYNLITAYSRLYNELLTKDETFNIFWNDNKIHLKEIIFNSTEFRTGNAFRFQKSESNAARIGNHNISIKKDIARKIRLSDILAASTCIPGGCEPLAFPFDFYWPENTIPEPVLEQFKKPLPLMDGGVYDNQGIESAMLADGRDKNDFGIFIISDVDQPKDNYYSYPKDRPRGIISLNMLNLTSIILFLFLIGSSITLAANILLSIKTNKFVFWELLFQSIIPFFILSALSWLLYTTRNNIAKALIKFSPVVGINAWNDIKHLTIDQFLDMAELRITSLIALTSDIFMKRIRDLIYNQIYRDKKYKHKRISNLIYDLAGKTRKVFIEECRPSQAIIKTANTAADVPTTFWFNNKQDLKDIIACGQFTICFNLLEYLLRKEQHHALTVKEKHLIKTLKKDWKNFCLNPYWLFDKHSTD